MKNLHGMLSLVVFIGLGTESKGCHKFGNQCHFLFDIY